MNQWKKEIKYGVICYDVVIYQCRKDFICNIINRFADTKNSSSSFFGKILLCFVRRWEICIFNVVISVKISFSNVSIITTLEKIIFQELFSPYCKYHKLIDWVENKLKLFL
jgi:hypothetical protein